MNKQVVIDIENPKDNDLISRQAVLKFQYRIDDSATLSIRDVVNVEDIEDLPSVALKEKIGHCKDCKHFQKLPYHAGALGKCVQHWGFCPPSDWYCADFEPQKVKGEE